MWKNYFKIAYRSVLRNKVRSFIHVIGLSIGIAICFLIFNVVDYSFSFDKFHPHKEDIFRVHTINRWLEHSWDNSGTPYPLASVIGEEISGVAEVAHFVTLYSTEVQMPTETKNFGISRNVIFAEPSFFSLFPRQLIAGTAADTSFNAPFQVVLSETSLAKYFPDLTATDAIGKEVMYLIPDTVEATVVGIVADFEQLTDFTFTDVISLSTLEKLPMAKQRYAIADWNSVSSNNQLFIKRHKNTSTEQIQTGLDQIIKKYLEEDDDESTEFYLSSLAEVHFIDPFHNEKANKDILLGLIIIGLVILLMACFNFINLETAHALNRAKEVGIRKTLGSSRQQLLVQFLTETLAYVILSMILAMMLVEFLTMFFKDYLPAGLAVDYTSISNLLFLVVFCLVLSFLSGIYPALVLSRYRPEKALKGEFSKTGRFSIGVFLRRNLTVIQFSLSIMFIISVLVVNQQIRFVSSQNLGFDKEALLYAIAPQKGSELTNVLIKNELESLSFVEGVSLSNSVISSNSLWTSTVKYTKDSLSTEYSVQVKNIDEHFLAVNKVPLLVGENIKQQQNEIIVNEALVKKLGFESPAAALGTVFGYNGEVHIVGVVADFHSQSLHSEIKPLIMYKDKDERLSTITVRLASGSDHGKSMAEMNAIYKRFFTADTYNFKFVDEHLERMYAEDQKLRKILGFATFIAILISCLGLFGLASWTISRRIKEISIRKVLGASVTQIMSLVSKEYVILVMVAFAIGAGFSYFITKEWLQAFAYRISTPWLLYFFAGLASMILALLIVSIHAMRADHQDPAEVLKSE